MNNKITLKTILQLILDKKPALVYGQIITLIAILVSVPIPLMLPVMVDEVLLDKPALFINTIDAVFGETTAFYYILIVTLSVIFLRFIYYFFTVLLTKIFTKKYCYSRYTHSGRILSRSFMWCYKYSNTLTGWTGLTPTHQSTVTYIT